MERVRRLASFVLLPWLLLQGTQAQGDKKNVLFIVSDDMRAELGALVGPDFPFVHPDIHTPNLDALASRSLLLTRAYVQQAVCSPSRTSTLTGRRPDTTRVYDLLNYFRDVGGDFTTIPQYFTQNGYITAGMGKIFHPGRASNNDDPISWNRPYFHASNSYWGPKLHQSWAMVDDEEVKIHPLQDTLNAYHAMDMMSELAPGARTGEEPFFLAVGFHRPHLPFIVPKSFYDLYPESSIRLPNNPHAPVDMPEMAWTNYQELRGYPDIGIKYGYGAINSTLPDAETLALRRGYYASISYTDSLVGQLMKKLDALGLSNNTVVAFWGDHGWQLGEYGEWCKHTNFELATHAPMMIRVPGVTDHGPRTQALTEFVDLFPTLVEAAGLSPLLLCPEGPYPLPTCREGVSVMPLAKDPDREWKSAVFSQYPRMAIDGNQYMGYSMRTKQYRYTEWIHTTAAPDYELMWDPQYGKNAVELYDFKSDPESLRNFASHPSYQTIRKQLREQLRAGWRSALPSW